MNTLIARTGTCLFLFGGLHFWMSLPASAANLEFKPSIAVSEVVNDNIYENPYDRRTDYITSIKPGFTSSYESSLWRWNAVYALEYRHFIRNSGTDEYNNNGDLKGSISLLNNFLFLDLRDNYQQIYTNIAKDQTTQSSLNINQTKQNTAIISPYLMWRLSDKNSLKTGYQYTDIRYWGEGYDSTRHDLLADFSHEFTDRLSITAGYKLSFEQIALDRITTNEVHGGFRYTYADKSSIFATIGNNWQQYENGGSTTFVTWNAGIIHDFSVVTAKFDTSSHTTVDPLAVSTTVTTYSLSLDKELQRGAIGLAGSYSEYADTETKATNERKLALTGSGRYEVSPGLTPNFSVIAEHYDQGISIGTYGVLYPYHLSATVGLSYAFNHDLIFSLNYFFDTYRNGLNDTAGATEINRVGVEVKKIF